MFSFSENMQNMLITGGIFISFFSASHVLVLLPGVHYVGTQSFFKASLQVGGFQINNIQIKDFFWGGVRFLPILLLEGNLIEIFKV